MAFVSGKKIYVDPGHGGTDPGAIGVKLGLQEKNLTLDIGLRLRDLIVLNSANVRTSRVDDSTVDVPARSADSNQFGADVFLSIHHNSAGVSTAQGIETLIGDNAGNKALQLATFVQDRLIAYLARPNRGVKRAPRDTGRYVYVIDPANTAAPSALAEIMFLSNEAEEALLNDPNKRADAALALFFGLERYFEWLANNP